MNDIRRSDEDLVFRSKEQIDQCFLEPQCSLISSVSTQAARNDRQSWKTKFYVYSIFYHGSFFLYQNH